MSPLTKETLVVSNSLLRFLLCAFPRPIVQRIDCISFGAMLKFDCRNHSSQSTSQQLHHRSSHSIYSSTRNELFLQANHQW